MNNLKEIFEKCRRLRMLCLEGVPDLPVAPQDEAGLTTTFQIRYSEQPKVSLQKERS